MRTPRVVLDDVRAGRIEIFDNPRDIITAHDATGLTDAFAALERARREGRHLAGYFAYELGYLLEPRLAALLPATHEQRLLWFGVFDTPPLVLDGDAATQFWSGHGRAYAGPLVAEYNEAEYTSRFDEVVRLIHAGDLFQANLTLRASFAITGAPATLYAGLREGGGAPYGAFIDDGMRSILSFSPELFIDLDASGTIRTAPMKGTAPRGDTPESDAILRTGLEASLKDRAENLMIVDLLRNDLGRICKIGSVGVDALYAIETLPTVHQMVSHLSARLLPGIGIEQTIRAIFPCGSITGAPKIRAMEILAASETSPRGLYCGAIGTFAPDGATRLNVAIRTVTIENGLGTLGIGGAVTTDSTAAGEWAECLLKAAFFIRARREIALIETLRCNRGTFVRFERHLQRMQTSAAALSLPFDITEARRTLHAAIAGQDAALRVRLLLTERGELSVTTAPIAIDPETSWTFAISPVRFDSTDLLLRHKTNWREVYDTEYARLGALHGCDEVLFLNERDELCEGARTNIFLRIDGMLLTPALSSGLLPGCLSAELIEQKKARETVLTRADLDRADAVFFGNSLRGLIPAMQKHVVS